MIMRRLRSVSSVVYVEVSEPAQCAPHVRWLLLRDALQVIPVQLIGLVCIFFHVRDGRLSRGMLRDEVAERRQVIGPQSSHLAVHVRVLFVGRSVLFASFIRIVVVFARRWLVVVVLSRVDRRADVRRWDAQIYVVQPVSGVYRDYYVAPPYTRFAPSSTVTLRLPSRLTKRGRWSESPVRTTCPG